jgi:hypothetical protein
LAKPTEARVRRFPAERGRIHNFIDAERPADRLTELDVWKHAKFLKCNPAAPLRPVRFRATSVVILTRR